MKCFLIAAITADGFIARDSQHISTAWTSAEDKAWFSQRTKAAKVIVMGKKTFDTIGRPLPGRLTIVYTREPLQSEQEMLRYTDENPKDLLTKLESEGYSEVAICGGSSIYSLFIKSGLVTKLYLTVEPHLFGQGISLFKESISAKLRLVASTKLSNQTVLLEYDVES